MLSAAPAWIPIRAGDGQSGGSNRCLKLAGQRFIARVLKGNGEMPAEGYGGVI